MSMMIQSGVQSDFFEKARKDLKAIENKGVSKLNTLEDLRDTTGKSFKTEDIAKLMEKYDPEAYEEYSKFAKTPDGAYSKRGLTYLSNWMDKVKKDLKSGSSSVEGTSPISKENESKLSKKAQDFLKNLREKYGDYDFLIAKKGNDLRSLAKGGSKEFSVIFTNEEIERMASDEKYADEKIQAVEGAVKMSKRIAEENGFVSAFGDKDGANGTINKITISVDDNGNTKMFAELEKTNEKQKERLEKAREKKAEEKKAEARKKKNPYEKDDKDSVKRTTVEADNMDELLEKINNIDWNDVKDSHSGDRFSFSI